MTKYAVYQCDKIKLGQLPANERLVASGFATAGAAMDHANNLARSDRRHSYTVGACR
jgi:hypothetical protein